MSSGIMILSGSGRGSARRRAAAILLGSITILSGTLSGAMPVVAAATGPAGLPDALRVGRLDAAGPVFVPPTADAGDDQSVPEGSVVQLDATRSTSSNLVTRTYTTSADFTEGTSINLTDTPPDQLRLDDTTEAFEFIWIAASNRGTVIKIDTVTGEVLGEYWSAPQNRSKDPSRTTVDHNGNVWVGNRAETSTVGGVRKGSVTQIGLLENGQCVDRNGNGTIETSSGLGDIKGWPNSTGVDTDGGAQTAVDECILTYVRTNGVAIRQVSVDADNHVWVGGAALGGSPTFFDRLAPDGTIVRTINMASPAQTGESGAVRCCYGGLVDPNGILWSSGDTSNRLVRIDPSKPNGAPDLMRVIPLGRTSYGLGIDSDGNLWQSNWTSNTVQKISPAGQILGTFSTGGAGNDRGVAATEDGDIWVANSGGNTVSRLRNNGSLVAIITVGTQPTGVAVDAAGKVWASNLSSSTATRIDPATNTADLTVSLGGGANPYNYSDMTGSTLTGAPDDGTWSVVYDSGTEGTEWAFVDWASQVPGDGTLTVTIASSADGVAFGPEVTVEPGEEIPGLAHGRYVRVTVRFARATTGESPVLFDLTVAHAGDRPNTLAYRWRLVDIDGPPVFLSSTTSPTPTFVAPDDASYTFELTVTDSAGLSDTDEVTVAVTNLDPVVEAEIGSAFARAVTLVNASFTDPGWLDTHAATFDWGDGTPEDDVAVTAQGTGWGTFFGSHVYAEAGSYAVSVTLHDDDGGSATVDLGQIAVGEPVAVWADSSSEKKTFEWTGGGGSITGRVHSNNEVKIAGTEPKTIDGPTEYVSSIAVTGPHSVTPVQSTVQPIPVVYDVADYAPGGPISIQVGASYFNHAANCVGGTWDVGSQTLPPGVHYAPCAVKINGSSISGRITLAATGAIELSGSNPALEPFYDGLLLLSGASGKKAINVSASSTKFLGVIYARSGEVSLSGSNSQFFCGVFGSIVTASGSNLTLRGATCGRPDSTVSGMLLVPGLELALAADPADTLPGGDIAYDLEVANGGSLLIVPGLFGLENVDTTAATVTGFTYALEYFSIADDAWLPIASLADGRITLDASANEAPGVSYPASDGIVGTVVGAGGLATWGYQALVELTPAEVGLLLDPARTGGFRNRVEFIADPASVQLRRLFTFGSDVVPELQALSGDITDASVTLALPSGDPLVFDGATNPELAVIAPGASTSIQEAFSVPIPAARSEAETDAGYLARLSNLDGAPLVGSSFALAEGGVGRLVAPLVTATTTQHLPVVALTASGPNSMPAGTVAAYDLALANQGSAAADDVALSASGADDPLVVSGAPDTLAPGELATATTTFEAPVDSPPADVTIAGAVIWSDAAGNEYGPVRSTATTQILTAATLSAILVDTLQTDVGGDGQVSPGDTVRYTVTISNHGGQPLTGVVATIAPDANSALVVGSVTAAGGTVVTGNGAGDATVEVTYGAIGGNDSATLWFDVVVDDPFPLDTTRLEVAGQVSADGFDPISTDDPSLFGTANPTRTTVVVPVPNLLASLAGRLQLDPDSNGFPSAGDTLRYELVVASVGSVPVNGIGVTVPTPAGTSIVPGSVTTTAGTVNGGTDVSVSVGSLGFLAAATIQFDLLIANPVPTGLTAITAQGTVVSDELPDLLTDDPATFTAGDPTILTIGAGGGGGGGVPGVPGPTIGTVSPADGTIVTEPVAIAATLTPPAGETVTSWTVGYRLEGDTLVTEIASGSGTTVAATLDPTVMPNGAYVVVVRAEGSAGGVSIAETSVVVEGQLKLGRYVTTYQDLAVGVAGLPMQVLRTYDSFDKSVGDFGVGWRLELSNFRIATNGPLGDGGWTMFGCGGGVIFVPLCFESSHPHYVTVTWPDGRVEMFDLTPAQGSTFLSGLTSAEFTARPRTTSTLEAVDSSLYFSNGNLLGGFFGSDGIYDPQRFRLTAANGTVYLLDRSAGLISATDRNGDTLTVTANGIVSSRGPSITIERDGLGRIEQVTGPENETHLYTYDAAGDLRSVTDANGRTVTYEYEPGHYLRLTNDPLNRPFQTLTYEGGRLASVIDAEGNEVTVDVDPDARTETVLDAEGRLTTISTLDERGNIVERREIYDGTTAITTFTYDEFDNVATRTDPLGHTWEGVYDERNLRFFTDPTEREIEIRYDEFDFPILWRQPRGGETEYHWNSAGQLTSIVDAYEHAETYTYEGGNRRTRTDREGNTWTYGWHPDGRLASVTDPLDKTTTYTYDDSGRLLSETDATDRTTSYTYWPDGSLKTRTQPGGLVTSYTYNELGLLASKTDPANKTTRWEYDLAGRLRKVIDPLDHETLYAYDANGRLETMTAPDGGVTRYTYDGAGHLETVEDPVGRVTSYAYDLAGRLESVENPSGGVTEYEYDDAGREILVRDPLGHETVRTHDGDGNVETILDPRDNLTRHDYDLADRLFKVTDAADGVTLTGHDLNGRVVAVTNPELETTTYGYDDAGRLASITNDLGEPTTFGYDDAGRPESTTDALGHAETRTYDAAGRLDSVTTASGVTTTYTYDPRGMVATVANELGHTTTFTYDDAGRLATERDPRGFTTSFGYDEVGRLTSIEDPLHAVVRLGYNLAGEQTSITDARAKTWEATYDALGGIATTTDPLDREAIWVYNDAGQLEARTDARGVTTEYDYDPAGNLEGVAAGTIEITYTHDELNRRKTMVDGLGTTTWSYDGASRLTAVQSPSGTIGYAYDDAGRRATMTLPSGTVTYGYFDDGRLASISEPTIGTFGFTYLADGRPESITRPNGVTTTDGYDAAGRLTSVTHTNGAATLASFTYVLDESGNRRSMTSADGTETYTLNELNQLTRVALPGGATIDYTYDPAGNRATRTAGGSTTTYTYDDASQLTAVDGAAYTYDESGNRLTGGGTAYAYDALGRLASATGGGATTSYSLDGDGRRVASSTGGATTPYLWDVAGGLDRLVSDGSTTYLHAGGTLLAEQSASSVAYPLADALGSVRAISDPAGAIVGTAAYDAFGATTAQSGATSIFGFAGEMSDVAGIYLRARTLDPTTGAFLQTDPVRPGAPGVVGYNLYSYAANNPTTWTDPSGRQALPTRAITSIPALTVIEGGKAVGVSLLTRFIAVGLILALLAPYICMAFCPLIGPDGTPGTPPAGQGDPQGQPGPGAPPQGDPDPDPDQDPDPNEDPDQDKDKNRCKNQGVGGIVYWPMRDENGERFATGATGRLTLGVLPLGTGTDRHAPPPPGYVSSPPHVRGHLIGRQLGGDGKNPANIVTLYSTMNNSKMRPFENQVRRSVESCNVVLYTVVPSYGGGSLPVASVSLTAIIEGGGMVFPPATIPNEP